MTCLISQIAPRPFIPELPKALSFAFLVSKLPNAEKLIAAGNGKPGELPVMRMGPWGAAALFATAASAAWERFQGPAESPEVTPFTVLSPDQLRCITTPYDTSLACLAVRQSGQLVPAIEPGHAAFSPKANADAGIVVAAPVSDPGPPSVLLPVDATASAAASLSQEVEDFVEHWSVYLKMGGGRRPLVTELFLTLVTLKSIPKGDWVGVLRSCVVWIAFAGDPCNALAHMKSTERLEKKLAAARAAELTRSSPVGTTPEQFVTFLTSDDPKQRKLAIREMGIGRSPTLGKHWKQLRMSVLTTILQTIQDQTGVSPEVRDETGSGLWALISQHQLDQWTVKWLAYVLSQPIFHYPYGQFSDAVRTDIVMFLGDLKRQLDLVRDLSQFPRHIQMYKSLTDGMKRFLKGRK